MARRGLARSIFIALFAAAGTAAAQFGIGYGLGIVAWYSPHAAEAALPHAAWSANLAWTTWIAATSVVAGAVAGVTRRGGASGRTEFIVPSGRLARIGWRLGLALSSSLGALVAVPLAAFPARDAEVVDNYAPYLLSGVYAVAGIVLGLIVAFAAVTARAIAANVVVTAAWLWVLAIVAMSHAVAGHDEAGFTELAVWKFTESGPTWRSFYIPGALLMLGAALLVGGLAALPAAGRGEGRLGVAISGAAGPAIVAATYVLAAPVKSEASIEQMSAFATAPYMVLAGLAGSLLVAAVGSVPPRRSTATAGTSGTQAVSPTHRPSGTVTATASVPASSRADPAAEGRP